jgi:hypothetical protein
VNELKEKKKASSREEAGKIKKPYYERYWWVPFVISFLALIRSFFG